MTEKKKPIIPGQDNLDPDLYGPKTSVSTPELGYLPTTLSRKLDRKIDRYLYEDLRQVGFKLPRKLIADFYLFCEANGYHRQYSRLMASVIASFLGGSLPVELSNQQDKATLRRQVEEKEIRDILQQLDNSRRRGIKNPIYFQEKLAKAAKKVRLTPELESKVRKELNLA